MTVTINRSTISGNRSSISLMKYDNGLDEAEIFIEAAGITGSTEQTAIRNLVTNLKSNSLWSLGEAIYPIIGGNASAHAINLKTPGTFDLTFYGTWTHSSSGMLPNGSSGTYAKTGWIPSTQHSDGLASMGFYSMIDVVTNTETDIGAYNATGTKQLAIWGKFVNAFYGLANCSGIVSNVPSSDSRGFFLVSRTGASANFLQKNSTQNTFTESVATPTVEVYIACRNDDGVENYFSNKKCGFAWLGSSLTTTQASTLYSVIQTYQTSLSRNV